MENSSKKYFCSLRLLHFLAVMDVVGATQIIGGPMNAAAVSGGNAVFRCHTDDGSCNDVEWSLIPDISGSLTSISKGTTVTAARKHKNSIADNCSLSITQVDTMDAGQYTCSIFEPAQSKSAFLAVYGQSGLQVTTNATASDVIAGDVVQLSCSLTFTSKFFTALELLDSRNTSKGESVRPYQTQISKSVTTNGSVSSISVGCSATFSPDVSIEIIADNVVKIKNDTTTIKILRPPTIISPASSCWCSELPLNCTANGTPELKYKWVEVNTSRPVSTDVTLDYNKTNSNSSYQCIVSNVLKGKEYKDQSMVVRLSRECCKKTEEIKSASMIAIGAIVGVVAVLIIVAIVIVFVAKKKRKKQQSSMSVKSEPRERSVPVNSSPYDKSHISGPVSESVELITPKIQNSHAPNKSEPATRESEVIYAEIGEPQKPARGIPRTPAPVQENVYSSVKIA